MVLRAIVIGAGYRGCACAAPELDAAFSRIWQRRLRKSEAVGIHGILFYELEAKKQLYPTRRDEEAINANGTPLR